MRLSGFAALLLRILNGTPHPALARHPLPQGGEGIFMFKEMP